MNILTALLLTTLVIVGIFFVIYQIERRSKRDGSMFTKSPSRVKRLFAILLAIVFWGGSLFFSSEATSPFPLLFSALSIALIAYGLGASNWLTALQGGRPESNSLVTAVKASEARACLNQLMRLALIAVLIVACGLLTFYGLSWVVAQPVLWFPFAILVAIGGMVLVPFHYIHIILKVVEVLKKHNSNKHT